MNNTILEWYSHNDCVLMAKERTELITNYTQNLELLIIIMVCTLVWLSVLLYIEAKKNKKKKQPIQYVEVEQ
jgi:hypothetical protein